MTKNEKARVIAIEHERTTVNDGKEGRIFEIECASHASRKTGVSVQGKVDVFVKWQNANGKRCSRPAECKTNGGRIQAQIDELNAGRDSLIIYRLDYTASTTKGIRRYVPAIIVPFSQFYAMLKECNALKCTNGRYPETAIQPSSKKMYSRLLKWGVTYDPERVYSMEDFEGRRL